MRPSGVRSSCSAASLWPPLRRMGRLSEFSQPSRVAGRRGCDEDSIVASALLVLPLLAGCPTRTVYDSDGGSGGSSSAGVGGIGGKAGAAGNFGSTGGIGGEGTGGPQATGGAAAGTAGNVNSGGQGGSGGAENLAGRGGADAGGAVGSGGHAGGGGVGSGGRAATGGASGRAAQEPAGPEAAGPGRAAGPEAAARPGLGAACSAANACQSGFCVDGVCCDSACNGTCASSAARTESAECQRLIQAARPSAVPRARRAKRTANSTLTTNLCKSRGACKTAGDCPVQYTAARTPCAGTAPNQMLCDGAGSCKQPTVLCGAVASCPSMPGRCEMTNSTGDASTPADSVSCTTESGPGCSGTYHYCVSVSCDGPSDCPIGTVCCWIWAGGQDSSCKAPQDCVSGTYSTAIVMCEPALGNTDCPAGTTCSGAYSDSVIFGSYGSSYHYCK